MKSTAPWLPLIAASLLCSGTLAGQPTYGSGTDDQNDGFDEDLDEVVVRGRRLSDLRFELEAARVRVYDVFNELNSDDAFDVQCRREASTGTRMQRHVCRPRFKDDISSAAAMAWMQGLRDACGGDVSADCIFSEAATRGLSRAQAEEAWEPIMQKRFADEMARAVAASADMRQAILDYEALERDYDDARSGARSRRCDRPQPPPRCSR